MTRIAGVNIPVNKRVEIALTYVFGIGRTSAIRVCDIAKVDKNKRAKELTEEEASRIREVIDKDYLVEGDLKQDIYTNIKSKIDMGTYQGLRHRKKLPVRGQRTHTNARTRKGKAIAIAGKKSSN